MKTKSVFLSRCALALILLSVGSSINVARAQRAIASLGAKLKRFASSEKSSSAREKYIVEGESNVMSLYVSTFFDSNGNTRPFFLVVGCLVVATAVFGAFQRVGTAPLDGEFRHHLDHVESYITILLHEDDDIIVEVRDKPSDRDVGIIICQTDGCAPTTVIPE